LDVDAAVAEAAGPGVGDDVVARLTAGGVAADTITECTDTDTRLTGSENAANSQSGKLFLIGPGCVR
jgi:hypothetical protein